MNRFCIFITIIVIYIYPIFGQVNADSLNARQLNEVVVKSTRRTEKGDTLSVIPSANQRKFSMTGYELLRGMMLPGLKVNIINGDLSLSNGEGVIVLIDGRPVDRQNILAIRPKEVARVEYIQNSGAEYGYDSSLGAVINFVMKQRNDGYAAAAVLNNAITTANGQNFMMGKYDKGNSEYALSFNSDYTSLSKRRIDNNNTYQFEEDTRNIVFKGMNTPLKFTENTLQAGYNHYVPKNHIFDITFKGVFYYSPDRAYAQMVTENGGNPYYQMTKPYEKYLSPQINLYYKRFLGTNSSFVANIVGSYRHTDYHYNIFESSSVDLNYGNPAYSYGTVSDRQSYIGEVKYTTKFSRMLTLSVGARGSYSYTSNDYDRGEAYVDRMRDTHIYSYASAWGYLGKLYYYAGIGLSGRIIDQNDRNMDKWFFRPELQFVYTLMGWKFNLRGVIMQNSPTLSEMASTEIRTNQFEIRKGNPDLSDWWKYRIALKISKKISHVNIQNTLSYTDAQNPVMSFVDRVSDLGETLFVTSFKNQKRMGQLSDNLVLDYGVTDNLSFSAGINFNRYISRGVSYSHNLDNLQFTAAADWFSGHWNVGINLQSSQKSLSGELYSYTGASNNLYVNYIIGNQWRVGIIGQYLFCRNGPTFKEEIDNRYMTKHETTVVPAQKNMIMITAAWNFSTGKQRKEAKIDLHNSDDNAGIFK